MQLTGPARSQKAIAVDETFRIGTNMAVLSLGFKGLPIRGLPFNDKLGILYNRYIDLTRRRFSYLVMGVCTIRKLTRSRTDSTQWDGSERVRAESLDRTFLTLLKLLKIFWKILRTIAFLPVQQNGACTPLSPFSHI